MPVPSAHRGGVVSRDLFAMHLLHSYTTWPSVPVAQLRLWDTQTTWSVLQPTRSTWRWARLDATVANARRHGAGVTMTLGETPRWASLRPNEVAPYGTGSAAPPRNIADWRAYVRAVATRYRGQISAYEVWNEPNWPLYWTGTTAQLVALTKAAHDVIKQVDPKAVVLSPSWVPTDSLNARRVRDFFAAGGGRYVDAVALHLYAPTPEQSVQLLVQTRKVLAQVGGGRLPVWNTEITYGRRKKGDHYSATRSAGLIARAYLLGPYSAQRRIYWYAWDDYDFGAAEMWSPRTRRATEGARAYQEVYDWMVGSRDQGCTVQQQVWSCAFALRGGGQGLAVWSVAGTLPRLVPGGYHHVRDLLGRVARTAPGRTLQVTGNPVLLTTR